MAFTYDKNNDMENIVKATGLSEDELASLIIAKENEGWSNAEIADLLASKFDNKEYASKAQNELDALYSLGFNPPKDYNPAGGKRYQQWQEYKEDPSLLDRFKSWFAANKDADEQRNAAAREAIAKSVNDWRDSHPEQWRVGIVNAMFGDNSLLSQYYNAENAAKENAKNREAQKEYNNYLKAYDKAQAQKEKDLAEAKANADKEKEAVKAFDTWASNITNTEPSKAQLTQGKYLWNAMSDADKNARADLGQMFDFAEAATAKEEQQPDSIFAFATNEQQALLKQKAQNEKTRIDAMKNGPEKAAAAEAYNAFIDENQSKVEGGLGAMYDAKQLKQFSIDANAELQKTVKNAIADNIFYSADDPVGKEIRKTHKWVKGTGWIKK